MKVIFRVWVVFHIIIERFGQHSSVELCWQYLSISTARSISQGMGKEKAEGEHVCAKPFDASLALMTSVGRRDGARWNDKDPQSPVQFSLHGQVGVGSIYSKTHHTKPQRDSTLSSVKHAPYLSGNVTQTWTCMAYKGPQGTRCCDHPAVPTQLLHSKPLSFLSLSVSLFYALETVWRSYKFP